LDDIQEDGSFWTKIPHEDRFPTHARIVLHFDYS
jgi:hypothetical protein